MRGNPDSTNIHVTNLPPTTTEESISKKVGRFGRLVSVKVFWPRTPEERARGSNKGFIAYASREEAEAAVLALTGTPPLLVDGERLRLSWGKPLEDARIKQVLEQTGGRGIGASSGSGRTGMTLAAELPAIRPGSRAAEAEAVRKAVAAAAGASDREASSSGGGLAAANPDLDPSPGVGDAVQAAIPPPRAYVLPAPTADEVAVQVPLPSSVWTRRAVDLVASYVAEVGPAFEEALRRKEVPLWGPDAVAGRAGR